VGRVWLRVDQLRASLRRNRTTSSMQYSRRLACDGAASRRNVALRIIAMAAALRAKGNLTQFQRVELGCVSPHTGDVTNP
jgi:hypothetical protein